MKRWRIVSLALALVALSATAYIVVAHAQTWAVSIRSQISQLKPVAAGEAPKHATYWSLSRTNFPPLPYNPFPDLPLFHLYGNSYLIWDLEIDYEAWHEQTRKERAVQKVQAQYGLSAAEAEAVVTTLGLASEEFMPEGGMMMAASYAYPAGSIYLKIISANVTNASLVLHGTDSGNVYSLFSETEVTNAAWLTEGVFRGVAGQDYTPISVPVGDRTNSLFFRACAWSSNDITSVGLSCVLTNPPNEAFFDVWPTNIILEAAATQTNGNVLGVAFYNGEALLGLVPGPASTYSLVWSNVTRGRYTLSARAFDDLGGALTSSNVNINVDPCYPAVDVVLVVDRSGSMGQPISKFNDARQACSNFVHFLSYPADQAGLVAFSQYATNQQTLTSDSNALLLAISQIAPPNDGTQMSNAIHMARGELTSSRHHSNALPVMVFLSDGKPSDDASAVLAEAGRAKTNDHIRLFTIGLGSDVNTNLMQAMASHTNDFFFTTNSAELDDLFQAIAARICRSNSAPSVEITCPSNNAVYLLGSTISLGATASDPVGGTPVVRFFSGDELIGTAAWCGSNSYSYTWADAPEGTNSLKAVATDTGGHSATSAVVTVTVIHPAPEVQFVSPTNNEFFLLSPTNILISVNATAASGTISGLSLLTNGVLLGQAAWKSNSNYQYLWRYVQPATNWTLSAIATDSFNGSGTNAVSLAVNALPAVSLFAPTNLQTYTEPTNVTLSASAWDADGTNVSVQFYCPTGVVGSASMSNGTNYNFTWNGLAHGTYVVTAQATDNRGAQSQSELAVFQVLSTNLSPVVNIIWPTNGATFPPGANITILATATNIGAGTVTNVEFFADTRLLGSDPAAPYSLTECCWKPGVYQLKARAVNDQGVSGVSEAITITITERVPASGDGYWDPAFYTDAFLWYDADWLLGFTVVSDYMPECGMNALKARGHELFVGGDFEREPYGSSQGIAKWDGTNWVDLGAPKLGTHYAVCAIEVEGTNVYIGGYEGTGPQNTVFRWTGDTNWVTVGAPETISGTAGAEHGIKAICVIGSDLYVGGDFTTSNGPVQVARFNQNTQNWDAAGDPLNSRVNAMACFNNRLIIGGSFTNIGSSSNISFVAELRDGRWEALGSGVSGTNLLGGPGVVYALTPCGTNLYVGGEFTAAGELTNANGIAIWDGHAWSTIHEGLTPNPRSRLPLGGPTSYRSVHAIAVRGNTLYVGGVFEGAQNDNPAAFQIARAHWSESNQEWMWSDLDGGVYLETDGVGRPQGGVVRSIAIVEGPSPEKFDVYVGGLLYSAGAAAIPAKHLARWRVGYPSPVQPIVTITNPVNLAVFTNTPGTPFSVSLAATAATNISWVAFHLDGHDIGYGTDNQDGSYTLEWPGSSWNYPTNGTHWLKATAMDANNTKAESRTVLFTVKGTNTLATDDYYTVVEGSSSVTLFVLSNDTPGVRITQVLPETGPFPIRNRLGAVSLSHDGMSLIYTPQERTLGSERFAYTVTNEYGTADSAWVTLTIRARPVVRIDTPDDGYRTNSPVSGFVINGYARDWDGTVSNITLCVNGSQYGQSFTNSSNFTFTTNWSGSTPGYYTFEAAALDSEGLASTSAPVTLILTNTGSQSAVAVIANLSVTNHSDYGIDSTAYPVIREGFFDLVGTALGNNPVAYQLLLFRPEDLDWGLSDDPNVLVPLATPFADLTTGTKNYQGFHMGSVSNDVLGRLDLTGIPNGIYDLALRVRGGTVETNTIVRVRLDSELKIGQFGFSEQDLSIPVNGIPITIIRTYNSLSVQGSRFGSSSSFGPGWTYALNSMDVQLDETRKEFQVGGSDNSIPWADEEEEANGLPKVVSIRTGGNWDVTLTLPDGRRATFAFKPRILGSSGKAYAEWEAPPGIHATLKANSDSDEIYFFPSTHWESSDLTFGSAPIENQDISGWILETQDGTKYHITRGEPNNLVYQDPDNPGHYISVRAYGAPKLTEIEQRSGDRIVIGDTGVSHSNTNGLTRSVFLERDGAGRITSLRDPVAGTNGSPVVKYIYNRDTGNLIQVQRLQDRIAGNYLTTRYHYNNPNFPHFITSIEDPRGIPLARNEYDEAGRLIGVQDADGNTTQFIHNLTNKLELTIDRLGRTNTLAYDLRGNVTASTNALGGVRLMAYDTDNNKTNEVIVGVQTNCYVFDSNGFLLQSVTGGLVTNSFTYNQYGQVVTATDGRGNVTSNAYDSATGNLLSTTSALATNFNVYNGLSRIVATVDAIGNVTTNQFDAAGNVTNTVMLNAQGVALSQLGYGYDENGNRVSLSVRRTLANGVATNEATLYLHDAQNRVTQTVSPDGATNTVVYNEIGKQAKTLDPMGRATVFDYNWQGRLTRTTHPDGTSESSLYDANGNRTGGVDRLGQLTAFVFDSLDRLTTTVFPGSLSTNGMVYDIAGRMAQSTDALGTVSGFGHDAAGRRVAVTNAVGLSGLEMVTRYLFDPSGNMTAMVDNLGQTNTFFYDALNRRTHTVFADGTRMVTTFDALGRRIAETDQATNTTWFGYDGLGRLVAVTNAQQKVTRYEYDELGNLLRQIDANNHTNTFEYDSMGRRTRHTLPGGQSEYFAYDLAGNQVSHTDFNGLTITNEFDVMNRLLQRWNGAVLLEEYAYDAAGRMTNRVDGSGTYTWAYDSRGRVTTNRTPAGTLCYQYDLSGNLTNCYSSTVNGVWVSYQHDALSRLTNVVDHRLAGANATSYRFDGVGNLSALSYPNGVTNLCRYDSLNRLTNLTWKLNAATLGDFSYLLGAAGNRVGLAESVNGASRSYQWEYDRLYRLTNETILVAAPTGSISYGFDAVGNRTNRTSNLSGVSGQNFTFDANDRLGADSYDSNGNTTNSTGVAYEYDYADRLTNANGGAVQMSYGADGMRASKTVNGTTTLYLVAAVNPTGYPQVLEELTVGSGATNLTRAYTYGMGLISQRETNGTVYFFGADGHGSTRLLSDTNATMVNTFAYDAYGLLIASNGPPQTAYLYTGQEWDKDINLQYLDARYYKPESGRFWTMDSFNGRQEDPISLHKYLYTRCSPVDRIDPSGNFDLSLGSLMSSTAIRAGLAAGTIGGIYGGYYAYRTGANVYAGTGVGFGVGFAGGYFLGPLPAAAFRTPGAVTLFAAISANQINHAIQLYQAGYYDLALAEGAMGIAIPYVLRSPAPVTDIQSTGTVKVFRGVHGKHPELAAARNGEAVPMGGHADPYEHNLGDVESIFTSWTTDRPTAVARANLWRDQGSPGVVLELEVPRAKLVDSPDLHQEAEVLLKGRVSGAKVTNP